MIEDDLIAAVVSREPGSRDVYADWLDENGHATRASFLRDGVTGDAIEIRARCATPHNTHEWRRSVLRLPIAGCERAGCPKDWEELDRGSSSEKRMCRTCDRVVVYASTTFDAAPLREEGVPFVLDPVAEPTWLASTVTDIISVHRQRDPLGFPQFGSAYPEVDPLIAALWPETPRAACYGPTQMHLRGLAPQKLYSITTLPMMPSPPPVIVTVGPLGFGRITERPSALRDLFAAVSLALPKPGEPDTLLPEIVRLLVNAFWGSRRWIHQPGTGWYDVFGKEPPGRPPSSRATESAYLVDLQLARWIDPGNLGIDRTQIAIDRATHGMTIETAPIATVPAKARPMMGRPYVVDERSYRALLVRRDDWR